MWSFLVLGIIPGTPIQITFALWVLGVIIAGVSVAVWLSRRMHTLRNLIIARFVAQQIRSFEVAEVHGFSK